MAKKKDNTKSISGSRGPMDMDLLEQMTRLMKENDLNTVDVRDGDKRVILKRGAPMAPIAPGGSSGYAPQYAPQFAPSPQPNPGLPSGAISEDANLTPIKSPMVGT